MNNENVGEQPILETKENEKEENGSPFGKFESLESLRSGYENLEKEFTRKSQLLKEFQQKSQEALNNGSTKEENLAQKLTTAEDTLNEVADEKIDDLGEKPYWEREDWNSQVQDFLQQNPLAKNYAKQISQTVLEDEEILHSKNPLGMAWAKWLETNFKTPEQLLDDPTFLEKVRQNENIKRMVIKDYVNELNNKPKAPPLFADAGTSGPSENFKDFPKTLEQAKEWAKKIFSN